MSSLEDKLLKLKELLEKGMNNKGLGGAGSIKAGAVLPSINNMAPKTGNNSATPSVSLPQQSKKNPIKQAEQIQNQDIKDMKMREAQQQLAMKTEVIKAYDNGQWKIEELDKGKFAGRDYSKDSEDEANMARRKKNNLGQTGVHAMPHIKRYSKQGADKLDRDVKEAKAKTQKGLVTDTRIHPETGEEVTVSLAPRKMKNYIKKMNKLAAEVKAKKDVDKTADELFEKLFKAREELAYLKKSAKEQILEDLEKKGRCWEGYKPVKGKKAYEKGSCEPVSKEETKAPMKPAPEGSENRESYKDEFEKKEEKKSDKPFHGYNKDKHSKEGGMSAKARKKYNRETGGNLQKPVTSKEAKGSEKKANRRKSFCARMSGVQGPTSKDGKLTRKGAALKRWDC